jgi:hypothetical protein
MLHACQEKKALMVEKETIIFRSAESCCAIPRSEDAARGQYESRGDGPVGMRKGGSVARGVVIELPPVMVYAADTTRLLP